MNEEIKKYLRENLSIEIKTDTSSFHNTSYTTSTCVEVRILLEGEVIASDSYYS